MKRTILALTATLLLATPALAADKPDDFDANGDGQITFPEVMQQVEKSVRSAFDAMDRNHDGVLSDKDFDDMRQGVDKLHRWLDELLAPFMPDDNGDTPKPEKPADDTPERMEV